MNLADIASEFPERYIFIKADICDGGAINQAFDTYSIDSLGTGTSGIMSTPNEMPDEDWMANATGASKVSLATH